MTSDKSLAQDSSNPDSPLERLNKLAAELSPFLDSQGRAFCYVKSNPSDYQTVICLDSEVAFSILNYRYYVEYEEIPTRSEVNQALNLARGKLWVELPPRETLNPKWSATIKAISEALLSKGDFLGSAATALSVLKDISRPEPKVYCDLPESADEMGIVLSRIGLLLRSQNIELFRPPRRDKERLWCWRLLTSIHDTSDPADTRKSRVSDGSKGSQEGEIPGHDTSDTLDEQLKTLIQISQGVLN